LPEGPRPDPARAGPYPTLERAVRCRPGVGGASAAGLGPRMGAARAASPDPAAGYRVPFLSVSASSRENTPVTSSRYSASSMISTRLRPCDFAR
jgi:hypothetical protein